MAKNNIESRVEELVKNPINELNYELYDVQYVKEGKDYFLRIIIDSSNGISIDDCEKVNNSINDILDEADFIKDSYYLEVCSPGIERILRKDSHFEKQIGQKINLKLFNSINKQKEIEGILQEYNKDNMQILVDEEIIEIENKNVAIAKTVADIFE